VYYHTLPLKYVVYGTILPHDDPSNQFRSAYEWLGHHCGYCPQIWLSRGDISMTGYRYRVGSVGISGSDQRAERDSVLFGFDLIHGFPIDYEFWWFHVLNTALNSPPGKDEIDRWLVDRLDWWLAESTAEHGPALDPVEHRWELAWRQERPNLAEFLRRHVFVERDQVVVPSLNLKTAKRILCRNERQKKQLRRMGFIEDRMEIRAMPRG
jgi:hypothetical protein